MDLEACGFPLTTTGVGRSRVQMDCAGGKMVFRKGSRVDLSLECHYRARPGGANDGKNGDKFAPFFIIRSTATRAVVAQPPF